LFYTNFERHGNTFLSRGYDDKGQVFFHRDKEFSPKIYLPSKNPESAKFKSLEGRPLEPFQPGSVSEAREFVAKYKDVSGFDWFGMENWNINYAVDRFPSKIDYDYNLVNLGFFDIETTCENGFPNINDPQEEILIVSFYNRGTYYIFSQEKYGRFETDKENVVSKTYATEEELLHAVVDFFSKMQFDVISGWNSELFDIPYMINRMKMIIGDDKIKRLSPWGMIKDFIIPTPKGDVKSYSIVGVNHIDYMAAFKKFSYIPLENYRLDTAGNVVLKMKKLDYSEHGSIRELYRNDFNKYCLYNLRDNEIMVGIEKKLKIIELITALALTAKVNMVDTFKQTVMWDAIFYNYLLERGTIVPKKIAHDNHLAIPGGFVKETQPGMYRWIVSLDLDSLYPHLIMGYNISPETYRGQVNVNVQDLVNKVDLPILRELKAKNHSLAGNGATFTKDFRGFIPELMDIMYQERKAFKQEMLKKKKYLEDNKEKLSEDEVAKLEDEVAKLNMFQHVRKIQLNSAYGSLAQIGFRFFMYELASAITLSGQTAIQWATRKLNEFMAKILGKERDYVLAADTDSIHMDFSSIVEVYKKKKPGATRDDITNFIDKIVEEKFQPYLNELYQELADYMNAYEQKMHMKRENIVEVGVYLAKKKYIYNVLDSEGVRYEKPTLKVTGLELVKSNTPAFCRGKMKEACKIVLEQGEDDLIKFIEATRKEFNGLQFEDIAYPQGVNHIGKYTDRNGDYKKGTQIYARGAIIYNKLLKQRNLTKKFETIGDGDKIKYCYLRMPNPLQENIISVPFSLPEELGLHDYVDFETQFEKTFIGPIKRITNAIGWEIEHKDSLEDFFS
jgi:DNA polymerase elongation subunit (family B)